MPGPHGQPEETASELYKTSHHFDTTEKKPEYLG